MIDRKTARDADLDAARAMILAAKRFHRSAYGPTVWPWRGRSWLTRSGGWGRRWVLLAGSWVRQPVIINPGYLAPRTFELLAAATHDRRAWRTAPLPWPARDRTRAAPSARLGDGVIRRRADADRRPARPLRRADPRYSIDAARLPIRFAEGCSAAGRQIAASIWPFFSVQQPGDIGFAYSLDGRLIAPQQTATVLVSAAAAAQSAGRIAARDRLLAQADAVNARCPTHFGGAWVALGRLELQTRLLGSCS